MPSVIISIGALGPQALKLLPQLKSLGMGIIIQEEVTALQGLNYY